MSNHQLQNSGPLVARTIHRFSVLIILAWLAIIAFLIICVPSLEQVEHEHSVSPNPTDAPSVTAAQRMDADFKQSRESGGGSGSVAMIVLEGQQPLGDDAHKYYDHLISQLKNDSKHVSRIADIWGDALTRRAAQSTDGKAAYVQVSLTPRPESIEAVRHIVAQTPAPQGVKAYS